MAEPGAKDAAMGGAVVACAEGAEALYYNAAALINVKMAYLSGCMNNGIYFADYYSLSWVRRLNPKRSIGAFYARSYNGGGVHYDPVAKKSVDSQYYDLNVSFSFAREISPVYAIGINAKYIRSVWGSRSVICDKDNGFAFDLGLLMRRSIGDVNLNIGLAFRNIGPDLGSAQRKLPSSVNLGFGIERNFLELMHLVVEIDLIENYQGYVKGFDLRAGTELNINEFLFLRGGFISKRGEYRYFVLGSGISVEKFSLDLAFAPIQPKKEPKTSLFWRISFAYGH